MPKDRTIFIFAAQISIDYLMDLDRGIKYAEELCQISEKSRFSVRARLMLGIAHSIKASHVRDLDRQVTVRQTALKHYLQAEAEDASDFLVHYHLALEYALIRKLDEAFRSVKKCLRINMDFPPAHHLLALLLSCWKRYEEALNVLEKVEVEFEEEMEVELAKIRLQVRTCFDGINFFPLSSFYDAFFVVFLLLIVEQRSTLSSIIWTFLFS